MAEIYPRWVAAHGIMIITPVYRYQAPSVLKLMIDRLVCADGGNPDPTRTHGKRVEEAKALELEGWTIRVTWPGSFAVVVHGDSAGAETLRRSLVDWLSDMRLYARSHEALDADEAIQSEVQNAARAPAAQVRARRTGQRTAGEELAEPRPK